jgi:hypothetical protein
MSEIDPGQGGPGQGGSGPGSPARASQPGGIAIPDAEGFVDIGDTGSGRLAHERSGSATADITRISAEGLSWLWPQRPAGGE